MIEIYETFEGRPMRQPVLQVFFGVLAPLFLHEIV